MDQGVTTTTLNRRWVFKMAIFIVALLGLGLWGTADAFWIYPKKGAAHERFMRMAYLDRLDEKGLLLRDASVEDPYAELQRLAALENAGESPAEQARREWLTSLSRIESLQAITRANQAELARRAAQPGVTPQPTETLFVDPRAELEALRSELANQPQPTGLRAYDIPLQYVFMAIGFGGGLWMLLFLLATARKKFRYDHAEKRLTLPDGRSFTPDQIAAVDKREWHKYFIHFTVEGFPKELKLDLLRFSPLEDWALEMERLHPNYEAPAEPTEAAAEPERGEPEEAGAGRSA